MPAESKEEEDRWRFARSVELVLFAVAYMAVLFSLKGAENYTATSAVKAEFLSELLPELDKETERLGTRQGGQNIDRYVQADDMARMAALSQRFCATQGGIGTDNSPNYLCKLVVDLEMGDYQPTHPNFGPQLDCSQKFLNKVAVEGDDPYLVPFGELPHEIKRGNPKFDESNAMGFRQELYTALDENELAWGVIDKKKYLSQRAYGGRGSLAELSADGPPAGNGSTSAMVVDAAGKSQHVSLADLASKTHRLTDAPVGRAELDGDTNPARIQPSMQDVRGVAADFAAVLGDFEATGGREASVGPKSRSPAGHHRHMILAANALLELAESPSDEPSSTEGTSTSANGTERSEQELQWERVRKTELQLAGGTSTGGQDVGGTAVTVVAPVSSANITRTPWVHHDEKKEEEIERMLYQEHIRKNFPDTCYTLTEESWAQKKDPPDFEVRKTCRNHHWGLIAACQPVALSLKYVVRYGTYKEPPEWYEPTAYHNVTIRPLKKFKWVNHAYFAFRIDFTTIGKDGPSPGYQPTNEKGVYEVDMMSRDGEMPGHKGLMDTIYVVIFFVFYLYLFGAFTLALLKMPYSMIYLWRERNSCATLPEATDLVLAILDIYHYRDYMPVWRMLLNTLMAAMLLYSMCSGVYYFWCTEFITPADLMTATTHPCTRSAWTTAAYTQNCLSINPDVSTSCVIAEYVFGMFFNYGSQTMHEMILTINFAQCMLIFNSFDSTRWIGSTASFAAVKLVNFLVVFAVLVFGFAFLVWIRFAANSMQFATWGDTVWTLLLFSFGITDPALEHTEPRFFVPSMQLYCYLLAYAVIVLTVALNVFTTIVLDAYSQAEAHAAEMAEAEWLPMAIIHQRFVYRNFLMLFPNLDPSGKEMLAAKAHFEAQELRPESPRASNLSSVSKQLSLSPRGTPVR